MPDSENIERLHAEIAEMRRRLRSLLGQLEAAGGSVRDDAVPAARAVAREGEPPASFTAEHRLSVEHHVSRVLSHADGGIGATLERVVRAVRVGLGIDICALWLPDEEEDVLRCGTCAGDETAPDLAPFIEATRSIRFPRGVGLPGRVLASGRAEWLEDLSEARLPRSDVARQVGLRTGAAAPLSSDAGCLGVIEWFRRERTPYDPSLLATIESVGAEVGQFLLRRRAEERLRESHRFLDELTAIVPGVLYVFDLRARRNRYVNRRTWEVLGYDEHELDVMGGDFLAAVIHPDDAANLERYFDSLRVLPDGVTAQVEYRMRHRDGTYRWLLGRDVVFERAPDGTVTKVIGVATDITERKRSEEALREGRERLRFALEAAYIIAFEWDVEHDEVRRVFSADDVLPATDPDHPETLEQIAARVHPDDVDRFLANVRAALANPTGEYVSEFRVVRADGTARWLAERGRVGFGPDGAPRRLAGLSQDVTERKRAEEAMRRSEAEYRSLFEAAGMCNAEIELLSGRFVRVNRRYCELVGYSESELLGGMTFLDVTHPDDREENLARITPYAHDRLGSFEIETRYVRKDGRVVWIHLTGTLIRDEEGRPTRLLGSAHDITQRKQAEQALRASESFHRQTLESIPGIVFTNTPDGACDYISEPWIAFTGVPLSAQLGDGWAEVLHPDDKPRALDAWRESAASTSPYDIEYRVRRFDGGYEWFKVRGRPMLDADGHVLRWYGAAVNVDDLKRAEAALVARERELQAVTDNTPDILTRFDRGLRLAFANASIERATGLDRRRILGKTVCELGLPTQACELWESSIRTVFEERAPRSIEFALDAPGGPRHYATFFIPEIDRDGEVEHVLGVSHDVTDRRRAEEALRDADRRKDEFLATLAHELRNPLAPIRSGLEILRQKGSTEEQAQKARDTMERQLAHLVRLVDDLLDVSRISRGKVELARERVRLQTVIEHAVETSRPLVDAGGHALAVDTTDEPVWIDGDLTRLAQVVSNLLNNASKYTPRGGHIGVSARREGAEAVVRVTDDGVGIASEMLPRVFDLFAQVDRTVARAQGGLGIGLSLARQLVEMHGGRIEAQSDGAGRGSTFIVRLPVARVGATTDPPRPEVATKARRTGLRVLVVDDNEDGADTLAMLLELAGHETKTASDGPSALEEASAFVPEVVFLDIGLPGMDGYEVARRMRADPTTAGAMLVALTGWGSAEDKRRSREAGFDVHLVKPVDGQGVRDVLARFGERRGAHA